MSSSITGKNSALTKPFIIAVLILWLQIPMYYIRGLIQERDISKSQATEQVAQMAGGDQLLTGPLLELTYATTNDTGVKSGERIFLHPHNLNVSGRLTTSLRTRGIFEVPVYSGSILLEGEFLLSDIKSLEVQKGALVEPQATFSLGIKDLRGIREAQQVVWGDGKFEFGPGRSSHCLFDKGIVASVPMSSTQDRYPFTVQLELGGSRGFQIRPLAKNAHVTLASNWKDPSFVGALIPTERSIDDKGFSAEWRLSDLSLGVPSAWRAESGQVIATAAAKMSAGVELISSIDSHRMSERATKYELLFFFLIFLAFFVYEVMGDVRIHPIQYLLVGAALTLFYMLILSLSEHVGFGVAYLVATVLSTGLVSGYARAILRRAGKTWIIPPLMVGMYGFLYTLLVEEDYALLTGSLGLAFILAVLMYITRNVDWFTFGAPPPAPEVPMAESDTHQQPVG